MSDQAKVVNVYSVGVSYCSVCAPVDMIGVEVLAIVNARFPTSGAAWRIADERFVSGDENPMLVPDCGRHWLLSC